MPTISESFTAAYQDYESNRLAAAEGGFRSVLRIQSQHPGALYFLGAIAYAQQRYAVAANYFSQAVSANPRDATFHSGLGAAYQALGQLAEALLCHQQARALKPQDPQVLNNLAITLVSLRHIDEALAIFEQARQAQPDDPDLLNNLGAALRTAGRAAEAIPHYCRAVELRPDFAQAFHNLGSAWDDLGQLDKAVACCSRAIELRPAFTQARLSLGVALAGQGRLAETRECLRQAHEQAPTDTTVHSTYLCCLAYDPAITPRELFEAHRQWGDARRVLQGATQHRNSVDPHRRLRIGYLSPDFRSHAVCCFVTPLLVCHDRSQVEVFCYADVAKPDAVTAGLRARADHWRDAVGLPDEQLMSLIQQDEIDILVDLAGHTSHHRLLLFARKPAPVQVSYLGYPCTTGLSTIDYRLTDAIADPPGEPACHTEELVRLEPSFCCYAPPADAPEVAPAPAERNGFVTFGSLHKLEKLNDAVLDVWSSILREIPSARLLLCRHVLSGKTADLLRDRFGQRGVHSERLLLLTAEPANLQHLRAYEDVDIALDAWPWNGHTTACEALWMGVPVLTLRGNRHASRMVASVLSCLDLSDWIADTPEDYVRRAASCAGRCHELAGLRATLRDRLRRSPLCDARSFCRGLEAAYRRMWHSWCEHASVPEHDFSRLERPAQRGTVPLPQGDSPLLGRPLLP